jgi:hypothetical protein
MNITKKDLKEFVVRRITTIVEEKIIMATDWEQAEDLAIDNCDDIKWEHISDHETIDTEEV